MSDVIAELHGDLVLLRMDRANAFEAGAFLLVPLNKLEEIVTEMRQQYGLDEERRRDMPWHRAICEAI